MLRIEVLTRDGGQKYIALADLIAALLEPAGRAGMLNAGKLVDSLTKLASDVTAEETKDGKA